MDDRTIRGDYRAMGFTAVRLMRFFLAPVIGIVVGASIAEAAETGALRVSIEGGAFNSKFKFFDAREDCPSYNDIPGAKDYFGSVLASDKGASKSLPVGQAIHVFLFRPRDTPGISAGGGAVEIRRRALQVVLNGDAELRYTGFEDHVPLYETSENIEVMPAAACESSDDEPAVDDNSAEEEASAAEEGESGL